MFPSLVIVISIICAAILMALIIHGNTIDPIDMLNDADFTITDAAGWKDVIETINAAPGSYTLYIGAGGFFLPPCGSAGNPQLAEGVSLTLRGSGTITLGADGSLFEIYPGVTLILDGPSFAGRDGNLASLVGVYGGSLVLRYGNIKGNTGNNGGGLAITSGGVCTMEGGSITDNTSGSGGGVGMNGGSFIMSDGVITGNIAIDFGGGIYIAGGVFTLKPPATTNNISGNTSGAGNAQVHKVSGTMNGPVPQDGW